MARGEASSPGRKEAEGMNRIQQKLIAVYLPMTLVIIVLDLVFGNTPLMWLVKFLAIASLFLWSFFLRKKSREQEQLGLSLLFVTLGDGFLYLPLALGYGESALIPYGMVMFILAYGCLILVYRQGLHPGRFEGMAGVASAAVFYLGLMLLWRRQSGPVIGLTLIFWGTLCTMLWMALCTRSARSPYRKHGKVIALSAVLMVVCDAGVGLGLLYPAQSNLVYLLARSIIWAAYIPAWTLIAWLALEEQPLRMERTRKVESRNTDAAAPIRDFEDKNEADRKI